MELVPFRKCAHNKMCQTHLFRIFTCLYLIISFIKMLNKLCHSLVTVRDITNHSVEIRVQGL